MKNTKTKLISSVTVLLICFAMLIGSTFAWFTDSASTGVNKIQAGNLDVQLLMWDGSNYVDISNNDAPIFGTGSIAQNKNSETLWEPGKTQVVYLAIKNNGNLALKYKVVLGVANRTLGANYSKLSDVMQYVITPDAKDVDGSKVTQWDDTNACNVTEGTSTVSPETDLLPGITHYFALSIHMMESASNDYKNAEVDFDLTVYAKQLNDELDSFDSTYDMGATYDETAPIDPPTTSVGTAEELHRVLDGFQGTGIINLEQDIDLTGYTWEPTTFDFSSTGQSVTINGNNHTISNLTTDGSSMYGGLIGKLNTNGSVIIKDLKLKNFTLLGNDAGNDGSDTECAGGALIGWMDCHGDDITVENVTVEGISVRGYKYEGGLIGCYPSENAINISNCKVIGTDTLNSVYSTFNENTSGTDNYKGHAGGLIGRFVGNGTITNCTVENMNVNRGGTGSSMRIGAVVGSVGPSASITSANVKNTKVLNEIATTIVQSYGEKHASAGSINVSFNND